MSRIPRMPRPGFRFSACITGRRAASSPKCSTMWTRWSSIFRMSARAFIPIPARCSTAWKKPPRSIAVFRPGPAQPGHRASCGRPMLDPDLESFTGCFEIPLRHGLTFGELADMANGEQNSAPDLHVIAMRGWKRGDWFDSTGLPWIDPSPNMRSLNAATLVPGNRDAGSLQELFGGAGHRCPFEQIRRRLDPRPRIGRFLNSRYIPGVRVYPTRFRPSFVEFRRKDHRRRAVRHDGSRSHSTAPGLAWNWLTRSESYIRARSPGMKPLPDREPRGDEGDEGWCRPANHCRENGRFPR